MNTAALIVGYIAIALVVVLALAVVGGKFLNRKTDSESLSDKWGSVDNAFGRHAGSSRYLPSARRPEDRDTPPHDPAP